MKYSAHQISLFIQLAIIATGLAIFGYLKYLDGSLVNPPLVINSDPANLEVMKNEYRANEMVLARLDFCKNRELVARVQWHLVDTYLTIFPARESSLPVGCEDVIIELERIPEEAHAGQYYIEGTVTYKINDLREMVYTLKTETFSVVE